MFEHIENIKLLDIHEGLSTRQSVYRDRFSHGFVFKLNGVSEYDFGGRVLSLEAGGMLYLPKGESYQVRRISQGDSRYILINFDGDISGGSPKLWSVEGFSNVGLIRSGLADLWIFGETAERCKCWSVFYHLLSYLATMERAQYAYTHQAHIIQPALDYLKAHLFDTSLKISQLHTMCGVSDTYFRRIFKANFAVNPQEYVSNKRLEQAATLISNGEYATVSQVAQTVGYSDALYFSRAFVRRYGICPTQYGKRHRQIRIHE